MLHFESRKHSTQDFFKINFFRFLYCFVIVLSFAVVIGCKENVANPNKQLTLEAFSDLKTERYAINSHIIRDYIDSLCNNDIDSTVADYRVRSYYLNHHDFLWIDRYGVDNRADTLLQYLDQVVKMGFTSRSFDVNRIKRDLRYIRSLDTDSVSNLNILLARLEYRMTKAYLRYAVGQRFGYTNPSYLLNNLDIYEQDSTHTSYRKLFDIKMQHPGKKFFRMAFKQIYDHNLSIFLKQIQPRNAYYYELMTKLSENNLSKSERIRILCNMERCRWRTVNSIPDKGKYVIVNIPAYKLYAVEDGQIQSMRVGCGAIKTKTPMLYSSINRIDVNPKWIIPMSIIKKDISRHAGNTYYFDKRNMYITYKKTGQKVDVSRVSASMLLSGDYRVVQDGGEGNSLGRIIFRFPNNFSVFLHDTSSKDIFDRDNRGVSHGCVRVDHPYELAQFILGNEDEELLEDIKESMGLNDTETEVDAESMEAVPQDKPKKAKMRTLDVKPTIPLFITYYTLYKDEQGNIVSYPDVYGYDILISNAIKPFIK